MDTMQRWTHHPLEEQEKVLISSEEFELKQKNKRAKIKNVFYVLQEMFNFK